MLTASEGIRSSIRQSSTVGILQIEIFRLLILIPSASTTELPPGSKVTLVVPSGQSLWVGTVKITVQLDNGETAHFFKKVTISLNKSGHSSHS